MVAAALAACSEGGTASAPEGGSPAERIAPVAVLAAPSDIVPDLYFVELEGEPTSRGGHLDRLRAERARFHRSARIAGVSLQERYTYTRLWNGLAVHLSAPQSATLREVAGVKAVSPVHVVHLDDAPGGDVTPDLFSALSMTGADVAQSTLGLTGDQVLVGVIDSGIDHDHPDLGGCFGVGCRVAVGYDFVGDDYDSHDGSTLPVPDGDPDDCGGHGTHVAGIIGANGVARGVAPGVTFGAYRVFGCSGGAGTDVILKAMETAAADGVRVLNLSLGTAFAWPESPESQAANQLVNDGVVVVASIGNSGADGLWAAGAPGNADLVLGAASVENTAVAGPAFQISPHDTMSGARGIVGFTVATGASVTPITGSFPLSRTGTPTTIDDACGPLATGTLAGQIALVRRGTCSFFAKATNAEAAGAVGVVFYDNVVGALTPTVEGTPTIDIPVVAITSADGAQLNAQLDAGPSTLSWGTEVISVTNGKASTMSVFSSFGLTAELGFKPDIAAPGGSIYSTWPLELGGYASLSGTSMASPHLAGAVALLLEARPTLSATEVRDVLLNNAVPALAPAPDGAVVDNVHRQGAGIVHIDAAVRSRVRATPATIALGESQSGPVTTKVTLASDAVIAVTYDVTHVPALSTTGTTYEPVRAASGYAAVGFDAASVTVAPGGSAAVSATITADPTLVDGALYGGYLVFTPRTASVGDGVGVVRVPYSGFKGDYQALQILTPTVMGYPWLIDHLEASQGAGATFTLLGDDYPAIRAHFEHAARRVKMDVVEATKLKAWGRARTDDYTPQNRAATGPEASYTFVWDGWTMLHKKRVKVPNGTYVIKLSVQKALGDVAFPADWESWTSPPITINHP